MGNMPEIHDGLCGHQPSRIDSKTTMRAIDYLRADREKKALKKLPRWMCEVSETLENQQRTIDGLVLMVLIQVVVMCALTVCVINK